MCRRRRATAWAVAFLGAAPLAAQPGGRTEPSAAERAITRGRLAEAESALYAASAREPREPSARGALGAFLASRGQLKAGAVLLEEARQFGGDARAIDERLKHIFAWTGEWQRWVTLPSAATFSEPEKARARWLAAHPAMRTGPDSAAVPLEPNEVFGLGRIALGLGETTVRADVDPNVEGLVLPAVLDLTSQLQLFGSRGDTTFAAATTVRIGPQSLANVPVRLEPDARPRVGLDVLASLTPTFDFATRRLTLHGVMPRPPEGPAGEQVPLLLGFPGVRIVPRREEPPVALESPAGRSALRGARWTFDARRGAIIVP
jgi:hypothetical protein